MRTNKQELSDELDSYCDDLIEDIVEFLAMDMHFFGDADDITKEEFDSIIQSAKRIEIVL